MKKHTKQPTFKEQFRERILTKDFIEETVKPDTILKTGFQEIDEDAPIILGQNTIITGRTGYGKTVLAVNLTNGILKHNPEAKIVFFSLELTKKALFQRLMATEHDIEKWKIERGFKNIQEETHDTELKKYLKLANQYSEQYKDRFLIYENIFVIEEIEKELDMLETHGFKPSYIVIDYANILSFQKPKENFHLEVSKWIMRLAKTRNIHVQVICQANRMTTEKADGFARTENLADSDQYGRDTYVVYSIKSDPDHFLINPTKNRNGKTEIEFCYDWNPVSNKIKNAIFQDGFKVS